MKPANSLIKFLITISNPKNNKILLKIAKNLFNNIKNVLFILQTSYYTYLQTLSLYSDKFAKDNFKSVTEEAQLYNLSMETIFKVANNYRS